MPRLPIFQTAQLLALLVIVLLLSGCEAKPKSSDQVTRLFWQAVLDDHQELAQGFILPGQTIIIEPNVYAPYQSIATPKLVIELPIAIIDTHLSSSSPTPSADSVDSSVDSSANADTGAESGSQPVQTLSFKTHLKQVNGRWLVDWAETERSFKAHALQHSMKSYGDELGKELKETAQDIEQLMSEALKEGSEQMNRALEELKKEMNQALEELEKQRQERPQQEQEKPAVEELPVY